MTTPPDLGVLAFTFWVEVFVGLMLTPWAVLNGEAYELVFGGAAANATDWFLLWFTGAYGGVRIFSQFALLKHTSATTLALSNVAIQALTTILGIFLFGVRCGSGSSHSPLPLSLSPPLSPGLACPVRTLPDTPHPSTSWALCPRSRPALLPSQTTVTNFLLEGVSVTLVTTGIYTYVKVTKCLEPPQGSKEIL